VNTAFVQPRPVEPSARPITSANGCGWAKPCWLVPEGTSTAGFAVRPFKTAALSPTREAPTCGPSGVHRLSARRHRPTATHGLENLYAWKGDMTLLPHLLTVSGWTAPRSRDFPRAVRAAAFADRKDQARHCRQRVAKGWRRRPALARPHPIPAEAAVAA
jgi:hypothetical protein